MQLKLFFSFFQSSGQLVGARGVLGTTNRAFQTGDDLIHIHALYQRADALKVSVAAANVLNILQLAVLNFKQNAAGAGAFGSVFVLHNDMFLSLFGYVSDLRADQLCQGLGVQDHLVAPLTGGYGDFIAKNTGFVNMGGVLFLHAHR